MARELIVKDLLLPRCLLPALSLEMVPALYYLSQILKVLVCKMSF